MHGYYEWPPTVEESDFRIFHTHNICFESHMHMQYEIVFVNHGKLKVVVNGDSKEIGAGELCVMLSNDVHSYYTEIDSHAVIMIFNKSIAPDFSNCFSRMKPVNRFINPGEDAWLIRSCFDAIMKSHCNHDNNMILRGHIFILLGHIIDMLQLYEDRYSENDTIHKVLQYLDQNYDRNISLEYVAKEIGMSRFHISRLFNDRIGCSFNHYLNNLRIDRAKHLLTTDKNITEISFDCGFESTRTFYRAFKEICGVTPRQLRTKINGQAKL